MNSQIQKLLPKSKKVKVINTSGGYDTAEYYTQEQMEKFAQKLVKQAGAYLMSPEFIGRSDLDWAMVLNEQFGVTK